MTTKFRIDSTWFALHGSEPGYTHMLAKKVIVTWRIYGDTLVIK